MTRTNDAKQTWKVFVQRWCARCLSKFWFMEASHISVDYWQNTLHLKLTRMWTMCEMRSLVRHATKSTELLFEVHSQSIQLWCFAAFESIQNTIETKFHSKTVTEPHGAFNIPAESNRHLKLALFSSVKMWFCFIDSVTNAPRASHRCICDTITVNVIVHSLG